MGIRIMLNLAVRDNYAFCCPEAPIHLSLGKAWGETPRLTDSILRGLKAGTLVDIDGVVDMETGALKKVDNTEKESVEETVTKTTEETTEITPDETEEKKEIKKKRATAK